MILQKGNYVLPESIGQGKGFAVHAEKTMQAMRRCGVMFSDTEGDAVLHVAPAHLALPMAIPGRPDILYTAYEAQEIPENYLERATQMELIICTSNFTADAFRRYLPDKPIEVCHLGVDVDVFTYRKRRLPRCTWDDPFTFLWVGAPNDRKNWKVFLEAWKPFADDPGCLLYIKTTGGELAGKKVRSGNVVIDATLLSDQMLGNLYHSVHCFVFPSYAEGFGLPLAEAMATGLPCLFVPYSGVVDFANEDNAYPIQYDLVEAEYGVTTVGAQVRIQDMVDKMRNIRRNYSRTRRVGLAAANTIRQHFTWAQTGARMVRLIEQFLRKEDAVRVQYRAV